MILEKMHKKIEYNYCFVNRFLGALFSGLLFCGMLQAESSLPGCQGSNFPTWTNCYGEIGPLPISGDVYAGEWKVGKYHGQGTIEYLDGTKYVGKWKEGLPNGKGILTDSSGNKYVGGFKDGKRHGQGTYTMSNGSNYTGQWEGSIPNGEGIYTFADGKIEKGIWKMGELIKRKK
jgi:hypothetical protein